jgi:hypothetical protein
MKNYFSKLLIGTALCTSGFAFAAQPASTAMVLSDAQMEVVTAGTRAPAHSSNHTSNNSSVNQNGNKSTNIGINPTVGANVALFNKGNQNVGAYNPQSGQTQIVKR